jgi:hypothetical protein
MAALHERVVPAAAVGSSYLLLSNATFSAREEIAAVLAIMWEKGLERGAEFFKSGLPLSQGKPQTRYSIYVPTFRKERKSRAPLPDASCCRNSSAPLLFYYMCCQSRPPLDATSCYA